MAESKARAWALALLLAVGATACTADEQEASELRFSLGQAVSGTHAPLVVAMDDGLYTDAGLDVEITAAESSHASLSSVAAGAADMASGDLASLVLARHETPDLPVVAVGVIHARAPYVIVSLADGANVRAPEDLDGVAIGLGATSTVDDVITRWADNQGYPVPRFQHINQGSMYQLVLAGRLEAGLGFVTGRGRAQRMAADAGREFAELVLSEWGLDDFYGNVFVANTDFAARNPQAVRAFLEATAQGYLRSFEDPDRAGEVLHGHYPTMEPRSTAATIRILEDLVTDGGRRAALWVMEEEQVSSTIDYLLGSGSGVAAADIYTNEYLE